MESKTIIGAFFGILEKIMENIVINENVLFAKLQINLVIRNDNSNLLYLTINNALIMAWNFTPFTKILYYDEHPIDLINFDINLTI